MFMMEMDLVSLSSAYTRSIGRYLAVLEDFRAPLKVLPAYASGEAGVSAKAVADAVARSGLMNTPEHSDSQVRRARGAAGG